jgi:ligand-binding sensor domain-containing protein
MYGGISMFDGKSFHNFTTDAVIDGVEAGAFFEDEHHNIWFAAENFGVYRYDGKTFINYYTESGLVTNGILSIYKDSKNRFWFGGWGGLFRKENETFTSVTRNGPWY